MSDETTAPEGEGDVWAGWDQESQAVGGAEQSPGVTVSTKVLSDHKYVLSITPDKAPFLVIRAESASELNQAITELEMSGVWANIAAHQNTLKTHGLVGNGLGHVQPVQQQAAPALTPQGVPMAPPNAQWGPPLGAGGVAGTAPAAWQNAGAPAPQSACPPGWFIVKASFQERNAFDAIKNQLQAQGLRQGNLKWDGNLKQWYASPQVAQFFAQFNPMPG